MNPEIAAVLSGESEGCIVQGDCLEIMADMPDGCVDLVLTDPPYGIGIAHKAFRQKFTKSDWDDKAAGKKEMSLLLRVGKEQVVWGGNYFPLPVSQGFFVWDKVQPFKFSSAMCEMAWSSRQAPAKLFVKRVTSYKKEHPTQKPIELMEWLLEIFKESDIILDPFCGSGTTCVAAKKLGRRWIGIELDEQYCEIARNRLQSTEWPLFEGAQ